MEFIEKKQRNYLEFSKMVKCQKLTNTRRILIFPKKTI